MSEPCLTFRPVVLVTVLKPCAHIAGLVKAISDANLPVILVEESHDNATKLACEQCVGAGVTLIPRDHLNGISEATTVGFKAAHGLGYTHVLQLRAERHRDFDGALTLIHTAAHYPSSVVCSVQTQAGVHRHLNNLLSNFDALTFSIPSAQSDVRVTPVSAFLQLIERKRLTQSVDFDTDVLIRLIWMGLRVKTVSIPVSTLAAKRTQRPLETLGLHARLMLTMVTRFPFIALLRMTGWQPRQYIRSQPHYAQSKEGMNKTLNK